MAVRVNPFVRKVTNKGQMDATVTSASKKVIVEMTTRTANVARQIAPRGTSKSLSPTRQKSGTLRTSHQVIPPVKINSRLWRGRLRNNAPYAIYVHNGTRGPINLGGYDLGANTMFSNSGGAYWEHSSGPYAGGTWYAKQVSGQVGNPWMVRAYNRARQLSQFIDRLQPMTTPTRVIKSSRGTRSNQINRSLAPRRVNSRRRR
jgi:hypothetical protein